MTNPITWLRQALLVSSNGSAIQRSVRVTMDTDGKVFVCRIPEISISATGTSAQEAYENLSSSLKESAFLLSDIDGDDVIEKVARLQRVGQANTKLRKASIVMLGVSALFFLVTIAVVPILDVKFFVTSIVERTVGYDLGRVADRIEAIDPKNREALRENIRTIMEFVDYVSADGEADSRSNPEETVGTDSSSQ